MRWATRRLNANLVLSATLVHVPAYRAESARVLVPGTGLPGAAVGHEPHVIGQYSWAVSPVSAPVQSSPNDGGSLVFKSAHPTTISPYLFVSRAHQQGLG